MLTQLSRFAGVAAGLAFWEQQRASEVAEKLALGRFRISSALWRAVKGQ
jgi:hypothetical protein